MVYILIVSIPASIVLGFMLGKFHERIGWNKLIDDGILPKPKRK